VPLTRVGAGDNQPSRRQRHMQRFIASEEMALNDNTTTTGRKSGMIALGTTLHRRAVHQVDMSWRFMGADPEIQQNGSFDRVR
jgi:hypothetical protein